MKTFHANLAAGGWKKLSLMEQMANVGSEVERVIAWRNKNQPEMSRRALFRGLELLDLTRKEQGTGPGLRETSRVRELILECYLGENKWGISDKFWQDYFLAFAVGARK